MLSSLRSMYMQCVDFVSAVHIVLVIDGSCVVDVIVVLCEPF